MNFGLNIFRSWNIFHWKSGFIACFLKMKYIFVKTISRSPISCNEKLFIGSDISVAVLVWKEILVLSYLRKLIVLLKSVGRRKSRSQWNNFHKSVFHFKKTCISWLSTTTKLFMFPWLSKLYLFRRKSISPMILAEFCSFSCILTFGWNKKSKNSIQNCSWKIIRMVRFSSQLYFKTSPKDFVNKLLKFYYRAKQKNDLISHINNNNNGYNGQKLVFQWKNKCWRKSNRIWLIRFLKATFASKSKLGWYSFLFN